MSSTSTAVHWMRVPEAAQYIGFAKGTLDKLRHFGGGPRYYKRGKAVLYDVADLDVWVATSAYTSTSQYPSSNSNKCEG